MTAPRPGVHSFVRRTAGLVLIAGGVTVELGPGSACIVLGGLMLLLDLESRWRRTS